MLYPTSYLKSKGLAKGCAPITDGGFSGGSAGLSLCHISPEAAEGGAIGLLEEGDRIEINIPSRALCVALSDDELAERRERMDARGRGAWKLRHDGVVSAALTTSTARGAVRCAT